MGLLLKLKKSLSPPLTPEEEKAAHESQLAEAMRRLELLDVRTKVMERNK